jgi:hypothetical protein
MEDERSSSLVSRILWWVGSVLLTFVLYVGSIGPLILVIRTDREYPILRVIYTPVKWASETPPFDKPIKAYAEWWTKMRQP